MDKWLKYPENSPEKTGWYQVAYSYESGGEHCFNTCPKFWSSTDEGFFDSIDSFDKKNNVVAFIGEQMYVAYFDAENFK